MVERFPGVGMEIVEFRLRRFDKLEAFLSNRPQRGPSKLQWVFGFTENRAGSRLKAGKERLQRIAIQTRRNRDAEQAQNRGHDVRRADLRVNRPARIAFLRQLHN